MFDLVQVPKTIKRKADATRGNEAWSIKNSRNSSTQVYLTTLRKLRCLFDIPQGCIDLFLGDKFKNRFQLNEIPQPLVDETIDWLNANTESLIRYVICGDENITHICFRDLNKDTTYVKTVDDIMSSIKNAKWRVGSRHGSFQLHVNGVVVFHLQREGKGKNPNNPLFHIHRNLFDGSVN